MLQDASEDLQTLAGASIPLPDGLKVTIFAPEDGAWPPEEELPTGEALLTVCSLDTRALCMVQQESDTLPLVFGCCCV
jgi:hypothetical protein